jgi:hypothetical protein
MLKAKTEKIRPKRLMGGKPKGKRDSEGSMDLVQVDVLKRLMVSWMVIKQLDVKTCMAVDE